MRKKNSPQTKKTSASKPKAPVLNGALVTKILKEFQKIVTKYSGVEPTETVMVQAPTTPSDDGFYMIFIKRNEKAGPDKRIEITTFGQRITIEDLVGSLTTIVEQTMGDINEKLNLA